MSHGDARQPAAPITALWSAAVCVPESGVAAIPFCFQNTKPERRSSPLRPTFRLSAAATHSSLAYRHATRRPWPRQQAMAPPALAPPAGSPAGYGKSCVNCSRAKCKCILRLDGPGCERCNRLGKECQAMTTSRKRTSKKSTSSRTAQLEEKLEDLVSILRASQQQPNQPTSRPDSVDNVSSPYTTSRLDSLATAATVSSHQPFRDPFRGEGQAPSYVTTNGFQEPPPHEAERRLGTFRSWLRNFPFFVLPPDMTAATLRQERPFFWMCINSVTTNSCREQATLKDKIRAEVAQRIVVDFERSMDLFLGLLTCLVW
jgi:hypothetical protein